MRRLFVLLLLGSAAASARAEGLKFQYTIEREKGGTVQAVTFLKGFDMKDGLRLRVKLSQPSHCYVIVAESQARYRLVFPYSASRRSNRVVASDWAKIPKSTFVRVGDDPGVERMYLVVASQRVPEVEDRFAQGATVTSETFALDLRDRYLADASYSRDISGDTISVKFQPRTAMPSVVIEEISLRAR